jgi:hypothetical protein
MAEFTRREAFGKLAATAGVGALIAATAARAETTAPEDRPESYHHEAHGSDIHVEWGMVHKPAGGEYVVKFHKGFAERPAIVLTPLWHDQNSQVSYIETLVQVSEHEFKGISDNSAENYFVSWVAIGKKRG